MSGVNEARGIRVGAGAEDWEEEYRREGQKHCREPWLGLIQQAAASWCKVNQWAGGGWGVGLVKGWNRSGKFTWKPATHVKTQQDRKKAEDQTREIKLVRSSGIMTRCIPRRRHCRRMPPDDMFFSASISVKLSELAKIRTSTRLTRRCKKVTEASTDKPWEGSMFSSSCWKSREKEEKIYK